MKIQLHENAIKNFNEKANNLLFEILWRETQKLICAIVKGKA